MRTSSLIPLSYKIKFDVSHVFVGLYEEFCYTETRTTKDNAMCTNKMKFGHRINLPFYRLDPPTSAPQGFQLRSPLSGLPRQHPLLARKRTRLPIHSQRSQPARFYCRIFIRTSRRHNCTYVLGAKISLGQSRIASIDLPPVPLENSRIIQHQHIKRRLAAPVRGTGMRRGEVARISLDSKRPELTAHEHDTGARTG
jgi:hypothetical protein